MREGTNLFTIRADLPVVESLGFAGELRKSGGSSYMSYPPVCWRPRANADDQQVSKQTRASAADGPKRHGFAPPVPAYHTARSSNI